MTSHHSFPLTETLSSHPSLNGTLDFSLIKEVGAVAMPGIKTVNTNRLKHHLQSMALIMILWL